jgi:hypothetical protein
MITIIDISGSEQRPVSQRITGRRGPSPHAGSLASAPPHHPAGSSTARPCVSGILRSAAGSSARGVAARGAADFDGNAAMLDALNYMKAARALSVPAGLEVSRSGTGAPCVDILHRPSPGFSDPRRLTPAPSAPTGPALETHRTRYKPQCMTTCEALPGETNWRMWPGDSMTAPLMPGLLRWVHAMGDRSPPRAMQSSSGS